MSLEAAGKTTRDIVLSMLTETIDQGEFSHLVLNRTFSSYELNRQNKVFVGRLFHGVLEECLFLDWIISSYSSVKINKIKPLIRNILRMGIYQMLFMDSVPDHAAINESVKLTKSRGLKGLVPFVNGILRSFQRGGIKPGMPENIKHAAPSWLYDLEVKELGKKAADAFFDACKEPRTSLYARLNTAKCPAEEIKKLLEEDGCEVEDVSLYPLKADRKEQSRAAAKAAAPVAAPAVRLSKVSDLTALAAYQKGLLYIQDISSMHVGLFAKELSEGMQVQNILDVCAAPGGKSLHLAELFPEADVCARDLTPEKVALMETNFQRSGHRNLRAEVHDALLPDESLIRKMDIVLADLPCSGLGVIGRKPDIKLRVKEEDLAALAALQQEILTVVSQYVKPGGLLIYSTCTVNRMENQDNAAWIAETLPFEQICEKQFLPGREEGDGFYLSCFRRAAESETE